MDYLAFWNLVDSTRGLPERAEAVAKLLQEYSPDDIVRFRLVKPEFVTTPHGQLGPRHRICRTVTYQIDLSSSVISVAPP